MPLLHYGMLRKEGPKLNSRTLLLLATVSLATVMARSNAEIRGSEAPNSPVTVEDKYFDMGGYRLHAVMAGKGKPSVVFEAGMGDGTGSWEKVQPEISKMAQTFSYDRPGLGKSDRAPAPHDLNQSADELHALLQKSGIPAPYILVGHSMGGLIVRVFAYRYPSETAGMVLVDPSDEGTDARLHSKMTPEQWDSYRAWMKKHLENPIMRLDMEAMTSGQEAAAAVPLPSVPKILLSASQIEESSKVFREVAIELHKEWVQKTPNAELVPVPTSEHYIQIVAPETVISAIKRLATEIGR
jgi:pimeloyl-ACP methyl ester carboxylesterase